MVTKEQFINTLAFIKQKQEQQDTLCEALETICQGEYVNAFIFADYEVQLVKMLKTAMDLPESSEDIEYFMYDLDFGKNFKLGMITENGIDIDMSSAEALYDYLVK